MFQPFYLASVWKEVEAGPDLGGGVSHKILPSSKSSPLKFSFFWQNRCLVQNHKSVLIFPMFSTVEINFV